MLIRQWYLWLSLDAAPTAGPLNQSSRSVCRTPSKPLSYGLEQAGIDWRLAWCTCYGHCLEECTDVTWPLPTTSFIPETSIAVSAINIGVYQHCCISDKHGMMCASGSSWICWQCNILVQWDLVHRVHATLQITSDGRMRE
eukprot:jgi/Ulvmu1/867/UM100_0019.1